MGGGKLPPRQKMIGMMYLVLTALLAMNVSKDILTAFVVVNEGLERTNTNFGKKNDKTYQDFKAALEKDPNKTKPYYDNAMAAQKATKELVEYIEKLKKHLIKETDKIEDPKVADTITLHHVNAKDNYDIPTSVMIGSEPSNPKTGEFTALDLRKKIEDYKKKMSSLFNDDKLFLPGDKKAMEEKINNGLALPGGVENGVPAPWEIINFYHLPLAGVITNLSAIQASVQNTESEVIQKLLAAVKGKDFTFDKLVAKVIAPSSYLIQGEEYKADVLLVAFNSTSSPKIYICPVDTTKGGDVDPRLNKSDLGKELPVEGGMGKYKAGTGSTGEQKWSGVIQVEKPGGGFEYHAFAASYMVAPPALVVSPTKMTVMYIGVDNPVDISVPGYGPESIVPSISAGSLSPDPAKKGSYIARVPNGTKEATISVSVKQDGKTKPLSSGVKFRVKSIPDPIAMVAGKESGGSASKSTIKSGGVAAILKGFDFELKVTVSSFNMVVTTGSDTKIESAQGNKFTAAQQAAIDKMRPGSRLIIEDAKVRMPDGTVRTLPPFTIKVTS